MPLEGRDVTRLTDMLHYATLAAKILRDHNLLEFAAFEADEVGKLALVRCVEVIGEAGHQVSAPVQAALPTVPWPLMWGMRNRLIHDYGHTDHRVVHHTVVNELPKLAATLAAFLDQHGKTV